MAISIPLTFRWFAAGFLLLALYAGYWWSLVFGGYYDTTRPPMVRAELLSYLPSDFLTLFAGLAALVALRRGVDWAPVPVLFLAGGWVYAGVKGGVAILLGTAPGDLPTHLVTWPYAAFGFVVLWALVGGRNKPKGGPHPVP